MSNTKTIYALYGDDDDLLEGVKTLKQESVEIQEVYTPFPVHGLDKLLGLRKTRISDIGFFYGVFGLTFAITMTWFMMIHDWPQNIGGKPSFAWYQNMPAFVPVMFELTVFCTAHFMSITFLFRCKLFPGQKPHNPDPRTTDDKFLVELVTDNVDKVKEILMKTKVEEITLKN